MTWLSCWIVPDNSLELVWQQAMLASDSGAMPSQNVVVERVDSHKHERTVQKALVQGTGRAVRGDTAYHEVWGTQDVPQESYQKRTCL